LEFAKEGKESFAPFPVLKVRDGTLFGFIVPSPRPREVLARGLLHHRGKQLLEHIDILNDRANHVRIKSQSALQLFKDAHKVQHETNVTGSK
jgi:hypothetical protein